MQETNTVSGIRDAVCEAVRVEMARKKFSQAKLAEATGLNQMYISRRMNADLAFNTDDLALIAAALEVPLSALIPAKPLATAS